MSRASLSLLPCVLALSACIELNPARPPPDHATLAPGGVWVAYNLGCEVGCDQIRRGDRILAVDGRPVDSGAEIDAINLARGAPLTLTIARYSTDEVVDVTLVATPDDRHPPIAALPPLLTVGTAALDRAPEWARSKLFGHAIPALRIYRADEPRGFVTGRQLYGRGALLVVWELPPMLEERRNSLNELPAVYAHLQEYADELEEAGVDVYFITDFRADPSFRAKARRYAEPGPRGFIPIYQLSSLPNNPNVLGLENAASDIREGLFDYLQAPVVLVFDRRGIVRFHARGFPVGTHETLATAVDFALHALPDVPPARAMGTLARAG
ncbi:MAG TPA: hypothetical protein VIK91_17805 [Nannocystis sp.]